MESDININVEESETNEDLTPEDDVADIAANSGRNSGMDFF